MKRKYLEEPECKFNPLPCVFRKEGRCKILSNCNFKGKTCPFRKPAMKMSFSCIKCLDTFHRSEIKEWKESHEPFSLNPFICPDCFDRLIRMDLEDQFDDLVKGGDNDQPL